MGQGQSPSNPFRDGNTPPVQGFGRYGGQPSSPNNYYDPTAPRPPFYAQSSPPAMALGGFQQGSANNLPQPPKVRRGPKVGFIIGVSVLLVILLSVGIFGYIYLSKSPNTEPASTTAPISLPKGPALFSDSFQNNNAKWDLTSKKGEFAVKVGGGSLVLEDEHNKLLPEFLPVHTPFNNFILNIDAILSKGTSDNGYGVYIRSASNQTADLATYYRFELYGDSTYAIFKGTVDVHGISKSNLLVNFTVSSAIQKQGRLNHISIFANGSTLSLLVNGQTLSTFSDNSYTSGSIALFVSNLPNTTPGAQATFSHLAIYQTQS